MLVSGVCKAIYLHIYNHAFIFQFLFSYGLLQTIDCSSLCMQQVLVDYLFYILVQLLLLSCVQLFVTPWTIVHQASLSITNSRSLLKLMSIESVMPYNHLILCRSFSSYFQSFPGSRSIPRSQFFTSDGQSIGASASASVLPWIFRTDFL